MLIPRRDLVISPKRNAKGTPKWHERNIWTVIFVGPIRINSQDHALTIMDAFKISLLPMLMVLLWFKDYALLETFEVLFSDQ